MMKMTVAVAVGVSDGVELGTNVDIKVSVGGGSNIAVWVWAAPAVATTIVWMVSRTAVGFDATGVGSPGSAHAISRNSAESKKESFLMDCTFMVSNPSLPGFEYKLHRTKMCFTNHE
jgi:hypothetical protein